MPWNLIISLVLLVVSAVITTLTAKTPTPQQSQPATISDFQIPQVNEGTPQAVVFGDVWLRGWQVLWYGNLTTQSIPAPQSSGGKK